MIARAISLLYRWAARDAPDGSGDPMLDDETNDLLTAYSAPRAESEQAVLDAMALEDTDHLRWCVENLVNLKGILGACRAELARRQARAAADALRREYAAAAPEIRDHARAALRRLESLR